MELPTEVFTSRSGQDTLEPNSDDKGGSLTVEVVIAGWIPVAASLVALILSLASLWRRYQHNQQAVRPYLWFELRSSPHLTPIEENPRQMARMMRKLFDGTGLQFGPGLEEAMRRLEAGEDPDQIEEEMGDTLEGEEAALFAAAGGSGPKGELGRRLEAPRIDRTLHEL